MGKTHLIIFGVGGILLSDGANPLVDILRLLGKGIEAEELQSEYEKHKEKGPWGLEKYAILYRGEEQENLKSIAVEYLSSQLRSGVQTTIKEFKSRGYIVGSLSAHPDFVMDILKEILDLDFAEGAKFEYKDGVATGTLSREFNRYDKGGEISVLSKTFNVKTEDIFVVANSVTQIPMIEKAGKYIAFNQKKDLGHNPDYEISDGNFEKLLNIFPSI